jgi:hypothetical protein
MDGSSVVTRFITVVSLVAGASGCQVIRDKLEGRSDSVVGSCTDPREDKTFGSAKKCTDLYSKKAVRDCSYDKSDQPCPRESAVAGCKHDGEVEWHYGGPESWVRAEDVAHLCRGTVLLPDGEVGQTKEQIAAAKDAAYMTEHGATVKARLATVASIAAKLPGPTGKLNLQRTKGAALIVHREDLTSLESPKTIPYRLKHSHKLGACARRMAGTPRHDDEAHELSYCANNPLLAVVSVTTYAPATSVGQSVSGNTRTTYMKRGRVSGHVQFFAMDDGKYLGSFPFSIENDRANASAQILEGELLKSFAAGLESRRERLAPDVEMRLDLPEK